MRFHDLITDQAGNHPFLPDSYHQSCSPEGALGRNSYALHSINHSRVRNLDYCARALNISLALRFVSTLTKKWAFLTKPQAEKKIIKHPPPRIKLLITVISPQIACYCPSGKTTHYPSPLLLSIHHYLRLRHIMRVIAKVQCMHRMVHHNRLRRTHSPLNIFLSARAAVDEIP